MLSQSPQPTPIRLALSALMLASLACNAIGTSAPTLVPTQPPIAATSESVQPTSPPRPTNTARPANTPKPTTTPRPTPAPPTATPAPIGLGRSNPAPLAEVMVAPNWEVQVLEMVRGAEAWEMLEEANQFNNLAPEGMEYLLINVHVKSTYADSEEHRFSGSDLRVTGERLIRYSVSYVSVPDPMLSADLTTGGETEGWAAYLIGENEGQLILIVDELANFEDDTWRFIALDEGAALTIAPELKSIPALESGLTRAAPAAMNEKVVTDNWEITVLEAVRGDEAWALAQEANLLNSPPADGMNYILIKVRARFIGLTEVPESMDGYLFRATGSANVLYDVPFVVEPYPQLDADLYPGGEAEGWVILQAASTETNLEVMFNDDPLRYIALDENATIGVDPELKSLKPTSAGQTQTNPAGLNEKLVTEDWEVTVLEIVRGDEAWAQLQAANQYNDPPADGMEYILVKAQARYIGTDERPAQISTYFFRVTGADGVVYDIPFVVEPDPRLDSSLYPGGEVEGWAAVQVAIKDTDLVLIFEPVFDFSGQNKRFIAVGP